MVYIEGTMVPMSTPEDLDRAINDPDEWGTPKRGRKSEKRQRSAVVSVRMTDAELAIVQAKAQAAGQTIGAYMRDEALGRHVTKPQRFVTASYETKASELGVRFLIDSQVTKPYLPPSPWISQEGNTPAAV